jgi:CubicO group peptidase (beta-lactamase class C family)
MAEGRLRLDGKVAGYVAGFSNAFRDQVTIFHLLTHTLEFAGRLSALKDLPPADLLRAIVTQELVSAPGAGYSYSNTASILLGMVIERTVNQPLPQVADQLFFKPMGMFRTTFFPEHFEKSSVAPTELDPWRGRTIQAEVHDESAWALRRTMVAGSAGLFSTVPDLLVFVRMLLNSGEHAGTRVLEPETVRLMHANQLGHIGRTTGLGWELFQPRFMGSRCTPRTFGKTGFTGCSVIMEPEAGFGFVLLSNCTFPRRRPDRMLIDEVRSECADILFAALE